MTRTDESARERVLAVLRRSRLPLDDDEIGRAADINRHYVNQLCRQLAFEGLTRRDRGVNGKLVNTYGATAGNGPEPQSPSAAARRPRHRVADRRDDIEDLVGGFAGYVAAFEQGQALRGPSLYFHQRAIETRRRHASVASLLAHDRFLEYVYAVLPAWGMHHTGRHPTKMADFEPIVTALRGATRTLESLWPLSITELPIGDADRVAHDIWDVIARINVSTSSTQIVAGSKFLHHVLPDLVPPIDRRFTFSFFTGRTVVDNDREAFLAWFPQLAEIGARCRAPIHAAIERHGFMATGEAKVIDNAIMGFMRERGGVDDTDSPT